MKGGLNSAALEVHGISDSTGADALIPLDQPADSLMRAFRTEIKNDGVEFRTAETPGTTKRASFSRC